MKTKRPIRQKRRRSPTSTRCLQAQRVSSGRDVVLFAMSPETQIIEPDYDSVDWAYEGSRMAWRDIAQELTVMQNLEIPNLDNGWPSQLTMRDANQMLRSYSIHIAGSVSMMSRGTGQTTTNEYRFQSEVQDQLIMRFRMNMAPLFLSYVREGSTVEFYLIVDAGNRLRTSGRFSIPFPAEMEEIARQEGVSVWRNRFEALFILCQPGLFSQSIQLISSSEILSLIPQEDETDTLFNVKPGFRQSMRREGFSREVKSYGYVCYMWSGWPTIDDRGAHWSSWSPTSNDEITNGLCLCSHCHILFDLHDIVLLPDYSINYSERISGMNTTNQHHGAYLESLPGELQFNNTVHLRPSGTMIQHRNDFYGINWVKRLTNLFLVWWTTTSQWLFPWLCRSHGQPIQACSNTELTMILNGNPKGWPPQRILWEKAIGQWKRLAVLNRSPEMAGVSNPMKSNWIKNGWGVCSSPRWTLRRSISNSLIDLRYFARLHTQWTAHPFINKRWTAELNITNVSSFFVRCAHGLDGCDGRWWTP